MLRILHELPWPVAYDMIRRHRSGAQVVRLNTRRHRRTTNRSRTELPHCWPTDLAVARVELDPNLAFDRALEVLQDKFRGSLYFASRKEEWAEFGTSGNRKRRAKAQERLLVRVQRFDDSSCWVAVTSESVDVRNRWVNYSNTERFMRSFLAPEPDVAGEPSSSNGRGSASSRRRGWTRIKATT